MYRLLRVKPHPAKHVLDADSISAEKPQSDPSLPITLRLINHLPENARKQIYRAFAPASLLAHFGIDPVSWNGRGGMARAELHAPRDSRGVMFSLQKNPDQREILRLELADNSMNGMAPNFIPHADSDRSRFFIAITMNKRRQRFAGQPDATREKKKEPCASGQAGSGLRASQLVFAQLETFPAALGQQAYFLEPMTFASAWLFKRRGFAYLPDHQLTDEINVEFQPGCRLHQAPDHTTSFRQDEKFSPPS